MVDSLGPGERAQLAQMLKEGFEGDVAAVFRELDVQAARERLGDEARLLLGGCLAAEGFGGLGAWGLWGGGRDPRDLEKPRGRRRERGRQLWGTGRPGR